MQNSENRRANEQEIDLLALFKRLWNKRGFILKTTLGFVFVGILVAIFSATEYRASCTVVPQAGNKSVGGSLTSLADMAGISLNDIGHGEILSPKVYSNIMKNVNLQKELMNSVVDLEGIEEPVTLLEYYTNDEYRRFSLFGTIKKYTIGLPGLIIDALKGDDADVSVANADSTLLQGLTAEEYACAKILRSNTGVNVNEKDGYVIITAEMPEALAAAQVAEHLMQLLQKYVTAFKIEKAASNYDFINRQYEDAKANYKAKQEEYAKFRDSNRSTSTAMAGTKEELLKNEYNLAYSLYSELAKQKVQAEIKVKENTTIFTVIEPVVIPYDKSRPKRAVILAAFLFLGFMTGCCTVAGLDYLKANLGLKCLENWQ